MATEKKAVEDIAAPIPKVPVKISEVLDLLSQGYDRKQIGKKLGLNYAAVQKIFKDPKLIGKKKKTSANVELIDDVPEMEVKPATASNGNGKAKSATKAAAKDEPVADKARYEAEESKVESVKGTW